MADTDFRRGAPVRTEEDTHYKLQVKKVDYTDPEGAGKQERVFEERGNTRTDGLYDGTTNTEPSTSATVAHTRDASVDKTHQAERVTAVQGDDDKVAMDVAISDSQGNHFDEENPLPVFMAEDPADEVCEFDDAVTTQNGGTTNHEYSVANGKTLLLTDVFADAESAIKVELFIGDGAVSEVFTRKAVRFANEDSNKADFQPKTPIKVVGTANTTTVRVVRTNRDKNDDQSIFTTICGKLKDS